MADVWETIGSLEDDAEEWVTEHSRSVYEQLEDGIHEIHHHHSIPMPSDGRTRCDHTEQQNQVWGHIYPVLMNAYLQWTCHGPPDTVDSVSLHPPIVVFDIFESRDIQFPLDNNTSLNITMVRHSYFGLSPLHPSNTVSVHTLELLCAMTAHCPQLSLQAFTKALCEIHQIAYRPILHNQLSITFDAYIEVHWQINSRVNIELQRDSPEWHLQNVCPPCMYTLEDEPSLECSMLVTMDGNESLKRVECAQQQKNVAGKIVHSENIE
ncbi:hypothetical protein K439DRAFT_1623133 [Ramaria rubella]|nr:hypothetical protein K439DRAFT_1623133 [Ramaria rubella]